MKTINIFGRKMPIVAILMALLVVGTASAAVVSYLSNEESAVVTVESPFTVEMSLDGVTWSNYDEIPLQLTTEGDVAYGGETSEFYVRYTNLADQAMDVEVNTDISCDVGDIEDYPGEYTIGNEDFENDLLTNTDDYEKGLLNGIVMTYSIDDSAFSVPLAINDGTYVYHNEDEDVLEIPVEGLNTLEDNPESYDMFPAETTIVVHYVLHHAPNALGTYTITTQVNDPDFEELES